MKQITRFYIRAEEKYAVIKEVNALLPNLTKGHPIKIEGEYFFVIFTETHFTEDGEIVQAVILRKGHVDESK